MQAAAAVAQDGLRQQARLERAQLVDDVLDPASAGAAEHGAAEARLEREGHRRDGRGHRVAHQRDHRRCEARGALAAVARIDAHRVDHVRHQHRLERGLPHVRGLGAPLHRRAIFDEPRAAAADEGRAALLVDGHIDGGREDAGVGEPIGGREVAGRRDRLERATPRLQRRVGEALVRGRAVGLRDVRQHAVELAGVDRVAATAAVVARDERGGDESSHEAHATTVVCARRSGNRARPGIDIDRRVDGRDPRPGRASLRGRCACCERR